jgi:hypothetical protein
MTSTVESSSNNYGSQADECTLAGIQERRTRCGHRTATVTGGATREFEAKRSREMSRMSIDIRSLVDYSREDVWLGT